ncbi:ABC transporter permease [Egicoccus halophilus]|uniref:Peptide ABC transporter permease n=1 Tax=Egicoccus halophilus TaxID=1670830 RepID=A0A8J3A8V6_9ACTN|nr:ABC transporter permease [Egicoccus halophilus]GGI04517.1 peptide ABC transporter permease [Egicoccus halophilus]
MLNYALRRLLITVPILILSTFLVFGFVSSAGDPLADLRAQPNITQEQIDRVREMRGLDDPFPVQYLRWIEQIPQGGFGEYLLSPRPIWPDLQRVIGNTLQLVVAAEVIAFVIAVVLGAVSAKRQYSVFDYSTTTLSFIGFSFPAFWFALILQVIVVMIFQATGVRIFPIANLSSANPGTGLEFWLDRAHHLVLPITCLAIFSIASYSRYMRASMLEVMSSDFIRTARAKGLPERIVTRRHMMRNALIPTVTVAALSFGTLINGAIVIETVFGLDGMGRYFINYLGRRDPYPIMAWLVITGTFLMIANLAADLIYGYLDPRIRYE